MSEIQAEIQGLEAQNEKLEAVRANRDLAIKLSGNREFKKLIMEEYMVNEAARLVQMSADPIISVQERADALAMAQASGHLKRYLSVLVQMGNAADDQIITNQQTIEELRAEAGAE